MVLALHGSHRPEETPRVLAVFEQLLEAVHEAEADVAVLSSLAPVVNQPISQPVINPRSSMGGPQ